ncbi:MAG: hypothetical protein R3F17_00530 [Planctomycetota bacterium]
MDEPNEDIAELPAYKIEGARSSRSKCKNCRKAIEQDTLRLGVLVDGRFGAGYMWYHLNCAARQMYEKVAEAYEQEAWGDLESLPVELPELSSLQGLAEKAQAAKKERKQIPYAELDPSGRAKCKHSGEPIPKGSLRVALGQEAEFGGMVRLSAYLVRPECIADALETPGIVAGRDLEPHDLLAALLENSPDLDEEQRATLAAHCEGL